MVKCGGKPSQYFLIQVLGLIAIGLDQEGTGATIIGHHRVKRSALRDALESSSDNNERKIALIADLDAKSKTSRAMGTAWMSYFKTGTLKLNYQPTNLKEANVTLEWEPGEPEVLKGGYSYSSRGMELSELINYNGTLLTCDDRTGIVYKLLPVKDKKVDEKDRNRRRTRRLVPWVILAGGDGNSTNGFKCEWATIKDGNLWIGSHGTTSDWSWVKEITPAGEVSHHNWRDRYRAMAVAANVSEKGYITHEAVAWSDYHRLWVFIPRKISNESYRYTEDFCKASNKIILADETFQNIRLHGMAGELKPSHGVSSFKWLPHAGTNHSYIVALKAEEIDDDQATFLLAFDMDGRILFPETKVEDHKYEGIEFI